MFGGLISELDFGNLSSCNYNYAFLFHQLSDFEFEPLIPAETQHILLRRIVIQLIAE